jgi:hypothetical protein
MDAPLQYSAPVRPEGRTTGSGAGVSARHPYPVWRTAVSAVGAAYIPPGILFRRGEAMLRPHFVGAAQVRPGDAGTEQGRTSAAPTGAPPSRRLLRLAHHGCATTISAPVRPEGRTTQISGAGVSARHLPFARAAHPPRRQPPPVPIFPPACICMQRAPRGRGFERGYRRSATRPVRLSLQRAGNRSHPASNCCCLRRRSPT